MGKVIKLPTGEFREALKDLKALKNCDSDTEYMETKERMKRLSSLAAQEEQEIEKYYGKPISEVTPEEMAIWYEKNL